MNLTAMLWGYDFDGNERVVDNHIKKLRKALSGSRCQIRTVRKSGYRMEVSV
ncbi:helix-turn-helix domain-containing protein [Mediterraneibacter glycyrrhizinilyticus]|nr:helix-turn-helix domain-containing protein [Mediterraneibacter glycyrrhizinilyticus]